MTKLIKDVECMEMIRRNLDKTNEGRGMYGDDKTKFVFE